MKSMSPRSRSFCNTAPRGGGAQTCGGPENRPSPVQPRAGARRRACPGCPAALPGGTRPFGIHIGGNGLPHGTARTGIVGNGQILHRYAAAAEKGGVAAEGVGGPPIRVGQLAAVPKDQGGGIGSRAPQGERPFFTDQLFPVDAGADADLCFQLVGTASTASEMLAKSPLPSWETVSFNMGSPPLEKIRLLYAPFVKFSMSAGL